MNITTLSVALIQGLFSYILEIPDIKAEKDAYPCPRKI